MIFFRYNVKCYMALAGAQGMSTYYQFLSDCNLQGFFRGAKSLSLPHVYLHVCHVHLKILETSF